MRRVEEIEYKRFAKEGLKQNGIKVNIKDMDLLETSCSGEGRGALHFIGDTMNTLYIDYTMFEDRKSGKQYQVFYGVSYYISNIKNGIDSLFYVSEYK